MERLIYVKSALVPIGNNPVQSLTVFVGLENVGLVNCLNATCDGKLRWTDGTVFAYDTSWMAVR